MRRPRDENASEPGHDSFLDIDNQEDQVDSADACQHIVDETFMSRDIDDSGR